MKVHGLIAVIALPTILLADVAKKDHASLETLKLGKLLLERRQYIARHSPLSDRLDGVLKGGSKAGDIAWADLDAIERAMLQDAAGCIGRPYSPNLGSERGKRERDFARDYAETRSDIAYAEANLRRHKINCDCSQELARMAWWLDRSRASGLTVLSVDPDFDQAYSLYKSICDERLRLGANIRNWQYAVDGVLRTVDFRRSRCETVGDFESELKDLLRQLANYAYHYNKTNVAFAARFETVIEASLEKLRQKAFAGSDLRPGQSFDSCGAFGFGGEWQTCLNFNVRNTSIWRKSETDFALYRDNAMDWSVSFEPEGMTLERFEMKEGSWVCARRGNTFRDARTGATATMDVWWSELAPGILYEAPKGTDAVSVSAAFANGPTAPDTVLGVFGDGVQVIRRGEPVPVETMREGWLLFAWNAGKEPKLPVLVYFARRPNELEWKDAESLVVRAKRGMGVGKFAVTTLWGARPEAKTSFDAKTVGQCRKVARLLANFPIDVEEFYSFEGPARMKVYNRVTRRENLADGWAFPAPDYAPFVPMYTLRGDMKPCEPIDTEAFATRFGFYRTVCGNVISYELPVPELYERIPLKPTTGEESALARLSGLATGILEEKSWRGAYVQTKLSGSLMDVAASVWMVDRDARAVFDGPKDMRLLERLASGEWGTCSPVLTLRARTADYQVDPISGRGAYLAGWRGTNLGMPVRGDMTLFNYVHLYAAYGQAKVRGRWDLLDRFWPRYCELSASMDFSASWRGPGVNTIASGALVYGDMFGDGMRGLWLMYRAALARGETERAAKALYSVTKEAATLANCVSPNVKVFNAAVKNIAAAASPSTAIGQLGYGHDGFRTAPWRPYSPEAWNAPFQSVGCHTDNPFFGCLLSFSRADADAWLADFTAALPEWHDRNYVDAQKCERYAHALCHVRYLAYTTQDRVALQKIMDDDLWLDPDDKVHLGRTCLLLGTVPQLIAQNDPVRIGEWGRARIVSATYDRATRTASVDLVSGRPEVLTLVIRAKPVSASVNGRKTVLRHGAFPNVWEIDLPEGISASRIVVSDDGAEPLPQGASVPLVLQKAPMPVLAGEVILPSVYHPARCHGIDLAKFVNVACSDVNLQGKTDEKWVIPSADVVRGVPFGFAKTGEKGMILLGAQKLRTDPVVKSVTIPVGRRVRKVYFLHGLASSSAKYYGSNGTVARMIPVLEYDLSFKGAPMKTLTMREGVEIGSWKVAPGCKTLDDVPYALSGNVYPAEKAGQYGEGVGGYVYCWENDVLAAGVTNQDVEQRSVAELVSITARVVGRNAPIILAITAEE